MFQSPCGDLESGDVVGMGRIDGILMEFQSPCGDLESGDNYRGYTNVKRTSVSVPLRGFRVWRP